MNKREIQIGVTYRNRGRGKTTRKVLDIGNQHRPTEWLSRSEPPDEPGVLFEQDGVMSTLYLSSFASWAGSEV